ncbi:MAG: universal stress protein [Chlorobiaceae bacterium]|jgi:nucleotide-binding universal stress UspA family protein|nr:universal stress protein [Chlorobiaceae bacterium]NTV16029.1 universal stress protein [Chlorobiaceae bacterium]
MKVYREILVAIDCSPVDDSLVEQVSALVLQLGATLHLLHVIHSHTLDQERFLRADSTLILDRYRTKLESEGIKVRVVIRSGEPEREILREIEENNYDLVAMAAHGHRLPERILFGSVSRTIRQNISIPLLLIKPDR